MRVLIVGAGPQALFMLRLYNRISDDIELVSLDKKVAAYSNIPIKVSHFETKEALAYFIRGNLTSDCLIRFAGGGEIQSILEVAPEIFDQENVQPNNLEALKVFASKEDTYQKSEKLKIATLPSIKLNELLFKGVEFEGPYLLKWNKENINPLYNNFKTKIFTGVEELKLYVQEFDREACDKLIVQKYLKVDAGCNVSYLGYYNKGRHSFGMLGQQILQYPIGITAHLIEYQKNNKNKLVEAAITLVESVGIDGFSEVEFIIDPLTNKFYLLEVNPRPCGWSSALFGKFKNLSAMITDNEVAHVIHDDKVEWVNILRYFKASISGGLYALVKAVIRVCFIKHYDVFSMSDLKPFFSQFKAKK